MTKEENKSTVESNSILLRQKSWRPLWKPTFTPCHMEIEWFCRAISHTGILNKVNYIRDDNLLRLLNKITAPCCSVREILLCELIEKCPIACKQVIK